MSALTAGLATFPEAIGVMTGSQVVSRKILPRLGPRRTVTASLVALSLGMIAITFVGRHTSPWLPRLDLYYTGVAMSGVFIPTQTSAFSKIGPSDMGTATTLFSAARQIASAVGVAVLTTVFSLAGGRSAHPGGGLGPFRAGFYTAAAVALLCTLASRRMVDREKTETGVHISADPAEPVS